MQAYRLTFRLPEMLRGWMFNEPEYTRREALLAKQTYFSDITVYRHDGQRDMLYRLEFSPESVVMGL